MSELVVNAILHYTSCPEAANEFGRDWVVSIVKDVVRDMVTNGELQAVSQPTSPKSESPTLAADDLADLGGVMGMFRSMLRSLSPPVSIYFETENINTLSQNGELLLTVLAAFAQDESVNKSISVAWGIRQRFAKGIPKLVKPYGYQLEDNKLIVDEDEAGVVIRIFAFYLGGKTPYEIAKILTSEGIPSPAGKSHWTVSSVTYILGNDRYCGDIIMQKSICVDLFAHKRVRNLGQAERFRVRDAHTPLVSKEDWREVKNRVSMPDREAVILEDITGEGVLAELHPIQFKEDVDI